MERATLSPSTAPLVVVAGGMPSLNDHPGGLLGKSILKNDVGGRGLRGVLAVAGAVLEGTPEVAGVGVSAGGAEDWSLSISACCVG